MVITLPDQTRLTKLAIFADSYENFGHEFLDITGELPVHVERSVAARKLPC